MTCSGSGTTPRRAPPGAVPVDRGFEDPAAASTSADARGGTTIVVPLATRSSPMITRRSCTTTNATISAAQAHLSGRAPARSCGPLANVGGFLYSQAVRRFTRRDRDHVSQQQSRRWIVMVRRSCASRSCPRVSSVRWWPRRSTPASPPPMRSRSSTQGGGHPPRRRTPPLAADRDGVITADGAQGEVRDRPGSIRPNGRHVSSASVWVRPTWIAVGAGLVVLPVDHGRFVALDRATGVVRDGIATPDRATPRRSARAPPEQPSPPSRRRVVPLWSRVRPACRDRDVQLDVHEPVVEITPFVSSEHVLVA